MAVSHCPACQLPLTETEARLDLCPICAASLRPRAPETAAAPDAVPRTRPDRRTLLLAIGSSAAVTALIAAGLWLATRERTSLDVAVHLPVAAPAPNVKTGAATADATPARAVRPEAAARGRAATRYPSPEAALKADGDDFANGPSVARAKSGKAPPEVAAELPPAPEVAAEKPAPPARPVPPVPAVPANNDLANVLKQGGLGNDQVQELLKMVGGAGVNFAELERRAAENDAELEKLFHMAGMQDLDLARSARTIQGLGQLSTLLAPLARKGMPANSVVVPGGVDELDLSGLPITDAQLEQLRKHPGLRRLNLAGTKVTGAGLEHFTKLQQLNLRGSAINDAALKHLETLTELRELNLADTAVSAAAVERLRQALPMLKVSR